MNRTLAFPLLAFMLGIPALVWAGDDGDKAKLQGTWTTVNIIDKGKQETNQRVKTLKLIIKGDKYVYQVNDARFSASFKLDASAKPRSIDLTFEDAPVKGKIMKAIYLFDGDELKICGGDKRPTEFTSTKESGTILFTFKREGK